MTAKQLKAALSELGLSQSATARALGLDFTTVHRQVHGVLPVRGTVKACVLAWLALKDIDQAETLDEARTIAHNALPDN
jgi:hypothetical protein